jgi:hypothetical protein
MLRGLILLVWLVMLGLNAPGHLSTDSLMQLLEGRSGIYAGAHPPLMSAVLGLFDRILPGTALYLVFSSSLFYVPLMLLAGDDRGRGAMNWVFGALLALALLTPLLLIYQGTVWKDVLFANLSLSAFTCLVLAQRRDGRARLALLASAALLAAFAASTRQNGFVVAPLAAAALGMTVPSPASLRLRVGQALAFVLLVAGCYLATQAAIRATAVRPIGDGMSWGLTILHRYDVVGMIANGARPFASKPASAPESERIALSFRRDYDPSRVDTLTKNGDMAAYFGEVNREPGHWWRMVRDNPRAWLEHRLAVFRWMIAPPDVRRCLPVWLGIDGLDATLTTLGIRRELRPQDAALYAFSTKWFDTPLFVNGAWALAALALAGFIGFRKARAPGDAAIVAMLASGLIFAASFALIGIACDVRYMFLLPVACCGALAYLSHAVPRSEPGSMSSERSVGQ